MATKKSERIGVIVILVVLLVGALGSYVAMALSLNNNQSDSSRYQSAYNEYLAAVEAQKKELSDQYYAGFSQYASEVAPFEASGVTQLSTRDLVIGSGETLSTDSEYSAYYIGWNPKGKIFDQSILDGALKSPLSGGNMIDGWNQGVIGMKFGGVRELIIPSDLAYGSNGSGEDIPANTPIKFVVMVIPKVADIEIPAELLEYYASQNQ